MARPGSGGSGSGLGPKARRLAAGRGSCHAIQHYLERSGCDRRSAIGVGELSHQPADSRDACASPCRSFHTCAARLVSVSVRALSIV